MKKNILIFIVLLLSYSWVSAESLIWALTVDYKFQAPLIDSANTDSEAVSSVGFWVDNDIIKDIYGVDTGYRGVKIRTPVSQGTGNVPVTWFSTFTGINSFMEILKWDYGYYNGNYYYNCINSVWLFDPVSDNNFNLVEGRNDSWYCGTTTKTTWFRNNGVLVWNIDWWGWRTYEKTTLNEGLSYSGSVIDYTGKIPDSTNIKGAYNDHNNYFVYWNQTYYLDTSGSWSIKWFSYWNDPNIPTLLYSEVESNLVINNSIDSYNILFYEDSSDNIGLYVTTYDNTLDTVEVNLCWFDTNNNFVCNAINIVDNIAPYYYNIYVNHWWKTDRFLSSYDIKRNRSQLDLLGKNNADNTIQRFYLKNDGNLYVDNSNPLTEPTLTGWSTNSWSGNTSWSGNNNTNVIFTGNETGADYSNNGLEWLYGTWVVSYWFSIWSVAQNTSGTDNTCNPVFDSNGKFNYTKNWVKSSFTQSLQSGTAYTLGDRWELNILGTNVIGWIYDSLNFIVIKIQSILGALLNTGFGVFDDYFWALRVPDREANYCFMGKNMYLSEHITSYYSYSENKEVTITGKNNIEIIFLFIISIFVFVYITKKL